MQQASLLLQPGSRRRPAGFVRASDLRDEELERSLHELHRHRPPDSDYRLPTTDYRLPTTDYRPG